MGVLGSGQARPLGLFEVLTRNRLSAVELFGRTRSAQEQTLRMCTIPPRQQLSSPTRLAIRRWRVARARIRIRIRIITHSPKASRRTLVILLKRETQNKTATLPPQISSLYTYALKTHTIRTQKRGRETKERDLLEALSFAFIIISVLLYYIKRCSFKVVKDVTFWTQHDGQIGNRFLH